MRSTKEEALRQIARQFGLSPRELRSRHSARMQRAGARQETFSGPAGRLLSDLSAHAEKSARKSILDKLNEEIQEAAEELGVEPEVLMELIRQKLTENDEQPDADEEEESRMERRRREMQESRAGAARASVSPEAVVAQAFHLDTSKLRLAAMGRKERN